jgi:hypothetical protein
MCEWCSPRHVDVQGSRKRPTQEGYTGLSAQRVDAPSSCPWPANPAALTNDSQVFDGRAALVLPRSKHAAPCGQARYFCEEVCQLSNALRRLLAISTQVKHLRSNITGAATQQE